MAISANDPNRQTWLSVPENSDFPIQNIPFGMFLRNDEALCAGTRIGDTAINLGALQQLGYFSGIDLPEGIFLENSLNAYMDLGKVINRAVRDRIAEIFDSGNEALQSNEDHKSAVLVSVDEIEMVLPIEIGDYTDFYSSKEHATNVGTMFRDPDNALLPNWLHIPVGYHGRASSVVVSGTDVRRPLGQTILPDSDTPVFGPSRLLDFEMEMAFVTRTGKGLGEHISVEEAEDYIFGLALFNDWSARDIQKWEYVPLGPFLAKNFASSISPWIVTMDALEPFRTAGPAQDPEPLPYLKFSGDRSFDISLEVTIRPQAEKETTVCKTNFKHLYWNMAQQLAHHTVNGCNVRSGDLMASGTISGPTPDGYGSMLEITWRGTKPVKMSDGSERKFIQDGDTVIMRGHCERDGVRIGFGEVSGTVLHARES
ncbi:MAG: fumarylacetoacetase [Flavobacteriales bacterium]|nr:fumarylacetoacetase [Flavobacteriales bacterium]